MLRIGPSSHAQSHASRLPHDMADPGFLERPGPHREKDGARFYRIDPIAKTSAQRALQHYQSVQGLMMQSPAVEILNRVDISV